MKNLKGSKTPLFRPGFVYYQNPDKSTFQSSDPLIIQLFSDTVSITQGNNEILIEREYFEDLCKQIKLHIEQD